jgi:hypothetical protein
MATDTRRHDSIYTLLGGKHGLGTDHHRDDHRDYRRRSSQTSKGARTRIVPHQIINAQAACPRPLVRAALLDLLGLVSLIVSPWTGVVLILVAGTGVT